MADDDEGHVKEELGRRTCQIEDLRGELWDFRDRAEEAEKRTGTLQQSIVRLEAEIGIRHAKANEMADRVALEEACGEDAVRHLASDAAAGVAELTRLRQEMAEMSQKYLHTQEEADEMQQHSAELDGEANATHARLAALQREVEFAREQLRQDEAAEEVRQVQEAEELKQRAAAQRQDAEGALAAVADEAAALRVEMSRLETGLATEKECSEGLNTALRHTIERHGILAEECNAMSSEVEALEAQVVENELADALAASKQQCQNLLKDLANVKSNTLMRRNSFQGALDETRRMLTDHLDQTQRHVEETQQGVSSIAILVAAFAEAKAAAAHSAAQTQRLEAEQDALEIDVRHAEEARSAEKERVGRQHVAAIEDELAAARQLLEVANQHAAEAGDAAQRVEASVGEAERNAQGQHAILHSKLEELWHMLRKQQQPHPPGSFGFAPQPRNDAR